MSKQALSNLELNGGAIREKEPCPHCGGTKTWKTWQRWPGGRKVDFWVCDKCRKTWDVAKGEGGVR